jgi:Holliday junction resolvase-like predicted endonuclease
MTDQELRDLVASLTQDVKIMRDAQAETTRKLEKIGVLAGNISNNQGDIAEEYFYNSLKDKQILAGIHYDFIDKNTSRSAGKISDEFDIVMVNGKDVAIIEVKYKAHDSDLEKLITKKYENFKTLYPLYKDYNHHLALASFNINEDLKQRALEQGVIVLQRKGDVIETTVPQ